MSVANALEHKRDAVLDSGCTAHTFPAETPCVNVYPVPRNTEIKVGLPNGEMMTQTHQGELPISDVP